ncbi:2-C-methyl-D-erythritol 4-phosphate cytidylyltransferase [Moraxella canis]|uniref:2-C-methyl-D-erythritol 4-phosphate cytidylyltransferase n=1 Tax=Moraxella canis TaxID=90239 RepID=A0ABZ0WYQ4_9GAMM|nr:2-C-methyl-D-erythritol 4-phosphate cytidylyltransferase [Moraxella canis]WQE04392.1 2-C-methyl-D-erythritol 4-phosphate cytidylyltransferase [Moraxella canis]
MKTTIYPLIVAAGTGSRFGANRPKQYLKIGPKSILAHSVSRLNHSDLSALTVVVADDDSYIQDEMLAIQSSFNQRVYYTIGGDERWQSVMNGLAKICAEGGRDDDWVLIHDAARPCLPYADLDRLIHKIRSDQYSAAILAAAVVDTLKFAKDDHISHTVSRDHLWQALTPQAFKIGVLKSAFEFVITNRLQITDEASACEAMGEPVAIVPASRMNIKLTYPDDLPLMEAILSSSFDELA